MTEMADDNKIEETLLDAALDNSRDEDSYVLGDADDVGELAFGDDNVEDPELEALKARVKEMEDEAEKLKELNKEVEDSIMSPTSVGSSAMVEDKGEVDARSVYVGNVDYSATPEEIKQHFHGAGFVNRVTILCDKFSGHPKGYAYVEFSDKENVDNAVALHDSLFKGRQIKVVAKRTNMPGMTTTDRGRGRGGRGRARGYRGGYGAPYYNPRGRGRGAYRARRAAYYSPY